MFGNINELLYICEYVQIFGVKVFDLNYLLHSNHFVMATLFFHNIVFWFYEIYLHDHTIHVLH